MIRITNLVKKYGKVSAVDDISLDVNAGEIFAFLGPNGAGKTTTIKMLTTLLRPTAGTIQIDGLDPLTRSTDVRRRFGIVFQDPSLDQELTAYENMDLHGVLYGVPRIARHQRTEHLLKLNEQEGVTVFLTTHYMEEAERVAQRIGIIDHGKIVAQGTAAELKQQTGTDSLEQAFLKLTGTSIRSETATGADAMRAMAAMWQRGRR